MTDQKDSEMDSVGSLGHHHPLGHVACMSRLPGSTCSNKVASFLPCIMLYMSQMMLCSFPLLATQSY